MSRSLIGTARAQAASRNATGTSSLLTGLVDYFKLDEVSGNRVGVKGTVLTQHGTVSQATGKLSNAASFDNSTADFLYLLGASAGSFNPVAASFTVGLWVQLSDVAADHSLIAMGDNSSSNASTPAGQAWHLQRQNASARFRIVVTAADGTQPNVATASNSAATTGVWAFVAAGVDTVSQKLFISLNGGPVTTTALTQAVFSTTGPLALGGKSNAASSACSTPHSGLLDAVAYWTRALTQTEMMQLSQWGVPMEYPWYRSAPLTARSAA